MKLSEWRTPPVEYRTFEVWQDGVMVASASGPREAAFSEALHYAMVYGQDGPCQIKGCDADDLKRAGISMQMAPL